MGRLENKNIPDSLNHKNGKAALHPDVCVAITGKALRDHTPPHPTWEVPLLGLLGTGPSYSPSPRTQNLVPHCDLKERVEKWRDGGIEDGGRRGRRLEEGVASKQSSLLIWDPPLRKM